MDLFADVLLAPVFVFFVLFDFGPHCGRCCMVMAAVANQLHSGVWVDKQDTLCLRLQSRKNRPQGSLLRRQCICATRGRQLCVVHRTSALLAVRGRAQPLWMFSSEKALETLRRFLILTDTPQAASYTLKAFRAGKATALAADENPSVRPCRQVSGVRL